MGLFGRGEDEGGGLFIAKAASERHLAVNPDDELQCYISSNGMDALSLHSFTTNMGNYPKDSFTDQGSVLNERYFISNVCLALFWSRLCGSIRRFRLGLLVKHPYNSVIAVLLQ